MAAPLESAVLVSLGWGLGLLTRPIGDWFSRRSEKKRLAAIIAAEIMAIKAMAQHALEIDAPLLANVEAELQKSPTKAGHMEINDAALPSKVFERTMNEIGVLNSDSVMAVSELYRWIEYANHWRAENLRMSEEFSSARAAAVGKDPGSDEWSYFRWTGIRTLHFAETYLKVIREIVPLSERALAELGEIAPFQSKYQVTVTSGEVLSRSFP